MQHRGEVSPHAALHNDVAAACPSMHGCRPHTVIFNKRGARPPTPVTEVAMVCLQLRTKGDTDSTALPHHRSWRMWART